MEKTTLESCVTNLGGGKGKLIVQGKGGKPGAKEGVLTPPDGSVEARKAQSDIIRSVNVELHMSIDPIHKGILIIEGPIGALKQIETKVRLLPLARFTSCLTEAKLEEILTAFPSEKDFFLVNENIELGLGGDARPTGIEDLHAANQEAVESQSGRDNLLEEPSGTQESPLGIEIKLTDDLDGVEFGEDLLAERE